ncbi:MAG: site-specific integrase [Candidatus Nanopelagicales bacterium]
MATKAKRRARRAPGAGRLRQLPSGRWQARFTGPDGVMRPARETYDTKMDAQAWLENQARDVDRGVWAPPEPTADRGQTLRDYSASWLAARELKPSTRALYRDLLDERILPDLGDVALDRLTSATVRTWHARLPADAPTARAHAYSLLRSIMSTAVEDDLVAANPCKVRGAGTARRKIDPRPATLPELEVIVANVPDRYRAMVLLAAWCGLRFGELTELRRGDVDTKAGVLRIRRGVSRAGGEYVVGTPKTRAGVRDVAIPPHLLPAVGHHLDAHTGPEPDALLFGAARRGGHMAPSALFKVYYPAREKAGRPDLRFHDLRHTGATLAAATGATLAELMARLGHSTPQAAMIYQHAAADRDKAIAESLSGFAGATVVPLRPRKQRKGA